MNEYLNDAKFIAISPDDYDLLQKYKADELKSNPLNFGDDKLDVEPFYNGMEHRIYSHRVHILKAYDFAKNRRRWTFRGYTFCDNDFIKTASDNDFFEQLDDLLSTHNL